jgi:hypothetical protein
LKSWLQQLKRSGGRESLRAGVKKSPEIPKEEGAFYPGTHKKFETVIKSVISDLSPFIVAT